MHVFLAFVFDERLMKTWLRDQLLTIYDFRYVDDQLLGTEENKQGVQKFMPQLRGLISELDDFLRPATAGSTLDTKNRTLGLSTTKTVPFNLTKPKPRKLPEPKVELKTTYKAREVPEILNKTSLAQIELARKEESEKRRKKSSSKYETAKNDTVLNRLERQNEKSKLMKQKLKKKVDAEIKKTMKSSTEQEHVKKTKDYYSKVKDLKNVQEIRPNAAAILREDAMYRKKKEKEAAIIRAFETDLRDTSEFDEWKAREEAKEAKERGEMLKARKEELTRLAEIAKEAVEEEEAKKRVNADQQRLEMHHALEQLQAEKEHMIKENQARTVEVKKVREQAKLAVEEVEKVKKINAAEIVSRQEERRKFREKQKEAELKAKKAVIKEIQAMVAEALVKSKAQKQFDPTTTSGVGSLEEMSLVELQERLIMLRVREENEVKEKRSKLIKKRESKREDLAIKLKRLERLRKQNADLGEARRFKSQKSAKEIAANIREKRERQVLEMHEKLESAREKKVSEALRLAKELKTRQIAKTFLDADAAKVEEQKWKQLQRGKNRIAGVTQLAKRTSAVRAKNVKTKTIAQRRLNSTIAVRRKKDFRKRFDAVTEKGIRRIERMKEEEALVATMNARAIKKGKEAVAEKVRKRKPYDTTIKRQQIRDARDWTTRTLGTRTLARAGQSMTSQRIAEPG